MPLQKVIGKHVAPLVANFGQKLIIRLFCQNLSEDLDEVIAKQKEISQSSVKSELRLVSVKSLLP